MRILVGRRRKGKQAECALCRTHKRDVARADAKKTKLNFNDWSYLTEICLCAEVPSCRSRRSSTSARTHNRRPYPLCSERDREQSSSRQGAQPCFGPASDGSKTRITRCIFRSLWMPAFRTYSSMICPFSTTTSPNHPARSSHGAPLVITDIKV